MALINVTGCNLCGKTAAQLLYKVNSFCIVKCKYCGLVYVNQPPGKEELGRLYQKNYFQGKTTYKNMTFGYADYLENSKALSALNLKRLKSIEKYQKKGRILDIGCAAGIFLRAAKSQGWEAYGVEINKDMAEYARQEFGLNVFDGELEKKRFPDEFFDVVCMWDVIEHHLNPRKFLEEIHRILKKRGMVCIETPNIDSIWARYKKARWEEHLKPPEHLFYFSRSTLSSMLNKTGFGVLKAWTETDFAKWLYDWQKERITMQTLFWQLKHIAVKLIDLPAQRMGLSNKLVMLGVKV